MAILPDNEYTEFEDRYYVNPQVALDEGNKFIDNLRSTQQTNNQQIRNQAYNLGKAVPSNLGGLVGGEGYFTSRYQTPQMTSLANNLRATNQANALKSVLENDQNAWKKRYTQAYQNYQKRTNSPDNTTEEKKKLGVDTNPSTSDPSKVSLYHDGEEYQSGILYPNPDADYVSDYKDSNGNWWIVTSTSATDVLNTPDVINPTNGQIATKNGKSYIYFDNIANLQPAWYPITQSAGPGTYSPRRIGD